MVASPITPACDCPSHKEIFETWPQSNAILRISSCMRVCPYCGKSHSNASRLRKHLKTYTYWAKNLLVEAEHAGVDVRDPHWIAAPSGENSALKRSASSKDVIMRQRRQPVSLVRQAVTEIQESFGATFGGLIHCDLHPLTEGPSAVQLLWQSCTTSLPMLYNSSQCWTVRTPSARELVVDALARIGSNQGQLASEEDFRINYQGEVNESINPAIVLAQLVDPDPCCPAFITGLRLPSVEGCGFRCPYDLCTVLEPEEECNIQVNMTPKFSFVDLHIDYGADGLSTLVGDCQKIWLLYPPTEANLRAMKSVDTQRAKLVRIMHQLEGGVVVRTTASHAIYIPPGCIHATFTLQGGFLIAKDFTSSKSLTAIASYLLHGLDQTLPSEARSVCYDWFERCLDVCLSSGEIGIALEAWIRSQKHLAAWAASHRQWRTSVRRIWEQYLHDQVCSCPCGTQEKPIALSQHVFTTHLNFLLPSSQLRRMK